MVKLINQANTKHSATIEIKIDKKMVNTAIDKMSKGLAKEMHHQFLFLRHLPEIKMIEKGEIKPLKNEEIDNLIDNLIKSK